MPIATQAGAVLEHVAAAPAGSAADLVWLVPVLPGLSSAVLLVFGRRLGRAVSGGLAIASVAASAVMATLAFAFLLDRPEQSRVVVRTLGTFIASGPLRVDWALLLDPLSGVMLLLVTWVGLLIHIYSLGYMAGDERFTRFFAYLNLFVASMLVLVLGESFLVLFVGWELVGLCSYLLIGFWFEQRYNASAAKKAFILNRVGDVGYMVAMFVVFAAFGSLSFVEVLPEAASLSAPAAAAIGLLLFAGATGKSAQIPLFVWLPDAMAGPTPVSALIHAATMVTAGVYLVARTSPIYTAVPDVGLVVAWVGVLTALLTALIACTQNDLKRILAYSTISQLGYMFVGVGVGDYTAGMFHLLTHGFFKALLFLAAGSVMHALHEETDVWRMGGLGSAMPVTFATAGVATLAISGFPFLSGFYSKEEILASAAATPGGLPIWVLGVVTAGLTAFYMTRWFVLIFLGRSRVAAGLDPHESPPTMWAPLVLLAVGSAVGGLINIDPEHGFLHGWLEPSVVAFAAGEHVLPATVEVGAAVAVALAGIAGAVALYLRPGADVRALRARMGTLYDVPFHRFYVDELYQTTIARPGRYLAEGLSEFDNRGIDGAVNGAASLTAWLATVGRRLQTGNVSNYALGVLGGALLVLGVFAGVVAGL